MANYGCYVRVTAAAAATNGHRVVYIYIIAEAADRRGSRVCWFDFDEFDSIHLAYRVPLRWKLTRT